MSLGLKQGRGGNDLASRTGNGPRLPVPRAVEGAETRRDSPDPGGGAARSGAALGVSLARTLPPAAQSRTQHEGPGTCAHRGGRCGRTSSGPRPGRLQPQAALTPNSEHSWELWGGWLSGHPLGAPQALPLASVSPSGLGSRLRKTLLVTTEGMQACTKGILRILHGSLHMQRSQRHSSFQGIQSRKIKPRATCGEGGSPGFFLKPFLVPSTNQ